MRTRATIKYSPYYSEVTRKRFHCGNNFLSYYSLCIVIMLSFSVLHAQTGPGGVGSNTNLRLWASADFSVFSNAGTTLATNNGNVQQWNNRSGNTQHLSQATAANRPTYLTNIVNGNPVIRFNAAENDFMLATLTNTANTATAYAVVRYSSLPSPNPGIFQGASSNPGGTDFTSGGKNIGCWVSNTSPFSLWGRGIQSNGTTVNLPQGTSLSANTFYSVANYYGGGAINQYVDGVLSGSVAYNNTLSGWATFIAGRQGNESWNGDIAELIAYNTNINAAQKIIVDNYLAAKYDLTTANDVYTMDDPGNGNFDFDVAGIGQISAGVNQTNSKGSGILQISNASNLGNGEFFMWGHDGGLIGQSTFDLPSGIQVRLQRIWRASEYGGDVGTMDLTFDLSDVLSSISNGANGANALRLIIDTNNDGSFADETTVTGGVISGASRPTGSSPLFTWLGVNIADGQRFTVGSVNSANAALPIGLIQFNAETHLNTIELLWATASEKNNDYFTIEKSIDGLKFDEVSKIDGAGNSYTRRNYTYVDINPYEGISYYRLKQTDYNGTFKYSEIVSVNFEIQNVTVSIFPNPVSQDLNLVFDGKNIDKKTKTVSVQNMYGKILLELETQNNSATIDFKTFSSGVYTIKTTINGNITIKKVVKE